MTRRGGGDNVPSPPHHAQSHKSRTSCVPRPRWNNTVYSRSRREESSTLLHHHERDKELTEAERDKLVSEGATIQGTVMHNEPAAADRGRSRVRVTVEFKDGQWIEFSE